MVAVELGQDRKAGGRGPARVCWEVASWSSGPHAGGAAPVLLRVRPSEH